MRFLYTFLHRQTLMHILVIYNLNFLFAKSGQRKLFIGGMFSWIGNSNDSLLSVCEKALKIVNNRTDILPEYELNLLPNDTKCNNGYGTQVLFEYLKRTPPIIMLLGAGCSSVTRLVAETAWQWNIVQVSYASTATDLSNKDRYPLLYRVVPSDSSYNAARLRFFKFYKWNRIATLVQNDHELKQVMSELHQDMTRQNFTLVASEIFTTNPKSQIRMLQEKGARIIVGMFHQDKARQVFCEAYKHEMYGAKLVWLLPDWFDNQAWWLKDDSFIDCTKQQMALATNGYFSIEKVNLATNDIPELPFVTNQDVRGSFSSTNMYASFVFDSVWVIAHSLHKASQTLHLENKTLDSFTYEDKEMAKIIQTSLEGLSIQGVTGNIKFNKQGDRIRPISIKQLQNKIQLTVAVYDPDLDSLTQNNTNEVMWQGPGPPSDAEHPVYQTDYISWSLFWFIIAVTSCAILLAILFLVFNIKYRHNSCIKLSSPSLNNVIIVGALVVYASLYSIVLDSRTLKSRVVPYVCSITMFLLGIGYSLMFGAMFSKTWRVRQILNKVQPKRKIFNIRDLIGLAVILVVMDGVVFSLWTALDPFTLRVKTTNQKIHSSSSESVITQYEYCHSKHMTTWRYLIFGYKGLLLLVGCFVAWETRGFTARSLNDSRLIGMSIFIIALAVFIGVPLASLIPEKRNAYIALISLTIFLPTTISLCLIFIPKISKVKKHPEEFLQLKYLTAMNAAQKYSDRAYDSSNDNFDATVVRLQVDLAKVKKELRDQKALNSSKRPIDINRHNDQLDMDTPRSTQNRLAKRSKTCLYMADGSKPEHSTHHRRCNTFSAPHPSNGHVIKNENQDLKIENESLRQKLRQTKINEAGKMCKVLYENAELNRKVVELSMKQDPGSENDTVSRLMKENNELKRQLGEVSILNSVVCDVTPKLKRKGTTEGKNKDLKELQNLLTVDLGGVRASSFGASRSRRPPTIGLSQSSLNLLDPKEIHREVIGESQEKEKQEKCNGDDVTVFKDEIANDETKRINALEGETKTIEQNVEVRDRDEQRVTEFKKDKIKTQLEQSCDIPQLGDASSSSSKPVSSSDGFGLQYADNEGFVKDDGLTISATKTEDMDLFFSEKPQHQLDCKPEKQFDKIWTALESSNTRELLRKGKVRLRSQTTYSTFNSEDNDRQLRRTLSADGNPNTKFERKDDPRSLSIEPSRSRTVTGSDYNDSGVDSVQLSSQYHTKEIGEEWTRNGEYPIERKQRKSKKDKKTKIEKVEKTFFV